MSAAAHDVPPAHAVFRLDAAGAVALPADVPGEALWHALSHRVMRSPEALGEHVRRLVLCRRPALHRRAVGALADLLHVLNGRGGPLAARMLAGAAPVLRAPERDLLGAWLAGDVPPAHVRRALPGSVLPTMAKLLDGAR